MDGDIAILLAEFEQALSSTTDEADVAEVERTFLGKTGKMRALRQELSRLDPADRRTRGAGVEHAIRSAMERMSARRAELEAQHWADQMADEWMDLTVPSGHASWGSVHPIRQLEDRCITILRTLGFELRDGPEVESAFFNFDALNVPADHPARDLQDTFWLDNGLLMRSHTTSIQARVLEERPELPLRVLARGRVYRNEAVDATHLAMFHQLEGFWVDRQTSLAELKYVLGVLVRGLYGERTYRIKPKYYPYTEPSIGLDIACGSCKGVGCPACHQVGWVTVIGAGMIHPKVLRGFGYDPNEVSGFAFGWGTTRLAYQWLGLHKVKDLYSANIEDLQHHARLATHAHTVG